MSDYNELLREGEKLLAPLEYSAPEFEVRELLALIIGHEARSAGFLMTLSEPVTEEVRESFLALCRRRLDGEPLQYILGEWEFYGLTFEVGRGVLIPRQDTELIVELALNKYKKTDSIAVLDLCAGTGCIGITLGKKLKNARVTLIEKSGEALEYLHSNLKRHRSDAWAVQGDVLDESLAEQYRDIDLIVCNPPYLTARDMLQLQTEVRAEPPEALFGGEDGLDFYRGITRIWKNSLKQGGTLIFEVGFTQAEEVAGIMIQHGFRDVRIRRDLAGNQRAVIGHKR